MCMGSRPRPKRVTSVLSKYAKGWQKFSNLIGRKSVNRNCIKANPGIYWKTVAKPEEKFPAEVTRKKNAT